MVFQININGDGNLRKRTAVNIPSIKDVDEDFFEGMKEMFDRYDNSCRNLFSPLNEVVVT